MGLTSQYPVFGELRMKHEDLDVMCADKEVKIEQWSWSSMYPSAMQDLPNDICRRRFSARLEFRVEDERQPC